MSFFGRLFGSSSRDWQYEGSQHQLADRVLNAESESKRIASENRSMASAYVGAMSETTKLRSALNTVVRAAVRDEANRQWTISDVDLARFDVGGCLKEFLRRKV